MEAGRDLAPPAFTVNLFDEPSMTLTSGRSYLAGVGMFTIGMVRHLVESWAGSGHIIIYA
jgi:hypothetical protein